MNKKRLILFLSILPGSTSNCNSSLLFSDLYSPPAWFIGEIKTITPVEYVGNEGEMRYIGILFLSSEDTLSIKHIHYSKVGTTYTELSQDDFIIMSAETKVLHYERGVKHLSQWGYRNHNANDFQFEFFLGKEDDFYRYTFALDTNKNEIGYSWKWESGKERPPISTTNWNYPHFIQLR